MQRRQRFVADQRYDLPQHDSMLGFISQEFYKYNKNFFAPQNRIVKNWKVVNNGGLQIKIDQTTDSLLFNTQRTGNEAAILRKIVDAALTLGLSDNATNYVEVKLSTELCAIDTVAIWDQTANGGNGEEFTQSSMTGTEIAPTLVSNTVAFTGDADRLPLAVITTAGGIITLITDARKFLFNVDTYYNFGSPRTDKGIGNMLEAYQALATAIREVKGTPEWFDAAWPAVSTLKEFQNLFFTDGGNIEFEGTLGAGNLGWTAPIGIYIADRTNSYSIPVSTVAIPEGSAVYVTIPTNDVVAPPLAPVVVPLSAVPINPASPGFSGGIQVLFYRINNKIYGMLDIPELSSGEVVIIGESMSNNNRNRLGLTSDTAFQPYSSVTVIALGDNYPTALSKLDAASSSGSALVNQDRSLKLVRGGLWTVSEPVVGTLRLTNALAAFVQINGSLENRNEIAAQNLDFTADGQCAYVSLNRIVPGLVAVLTVTIALIDAVPNGPNTFIIARRVNGRVEVGSLALLKGEFRYLNFGLSENNKSLIGGSVTPIDEQSASALWATRGSPLRNILATDSALDATASLDKELDKFFGQLKITPHATDIFKALITGVDRTMLDGSVLSQEMKNLVMDFNGAVINFATGSITKADGITALGQNFTPFTIPVGSYFWYGVGIIPGTVNANNTIGAQVLITPAASANAVIGLAPLAAVGGTKKIGLLRVQNLAGVVTRNLIRQFGTGSGGGGSGSGNANDFYIELKRRLDQSLYGWFTSNIALSDEDKLIDKVGSTATFDIANNLFKFTSIGSVLLSLQQYGSSFLGLNPLVPEDGFREHIEVELQTLWNVDDPLAVHQVSRDGGLNYTPVTMKRVGASKHYVGSALFANPIVTETLVQYPTAVTPIGLDINPATPKRAVKVIVTEKSKYQNFIFQYEKLGTPSGLFTFSWVKDLAGVPSNDILASRDIPVSTLIAGLNSLSISVPTILPPGTYWMVIGGDATYLASYANATSEVEIRADIAGTYAGGLSYQFNGTTWSATASRQITFGTSGFRYRLLVRITNGTLDSTLEGYGVFFGEQGGAIEPAVEEPQYFRFSGSLDQTDFLITNFYPNPKRVRATFVNSGLTFIHPFFDVIGNLLKFNAGTFLYPGMDLILKVENMELGGASNIDVSKINALLAENALGSENGVLDLSQAGKGIKIRRPDGTLRMIRLDNNDDLIVESLP